MSNHAEDTSLLVGLSLGLIGSGVIHVAVVGRTALAVGIAALGYAFGFWATIRHYGGIKGWLGINE